MEAPAGAQCHSRRADVVERSLEGHHYECRVNGASHLSTEPTASSGPSGLRVEGSPLAPHVRSRAVVAGRAARLKARRRPLRDFVPLRAATAGCRPRGAAAVLGRGAHSPTSSGLEPGGRAVASGQLRQSSSFVPWMPHRRQWRGGSRLRTCLVNIGRSARAAAAKCCSPMLWAAFEEVSRPALFLQTSALFLWL